jgi:hypothetical protein
MEYTEKVAMQEAERTEVGDYKSVLDTLATFRSMSKPIDRAQMSFGGG